LEKGIVQTINMLPATKRLNMEVVRQQTVSQKCVESMRQYCSVHLEAVLACPLAKVCIYQHYITVTSQSTKSKFVCYPQHIANTAKSSFQPNGISRHMGKGGIFCRNANQEGTV